MIDKLRAAAMSALDDSAMRPLRQMLDARELADPAALSARLDWAAAQNLNPRARVAVDKARDAVEQWNEAAGLEQRISAAWHDPKLRAEFTPKQFEMARRDPERALKELSKLSVQRKLSKEGERAYNVLQEAILAHTEGGNKLPAAAPESLPTNARDIEVELIALTKKSVAGKLTKDEDARYNKLLGAQIDQQEADEQPRSANGRFSSGKPRDREARLKELSRKSIRGQLTAEEDSEYNRLAIEAEVASGRIEAPPPAEPSDADVIENIQPVAEYNE